MVIRLYCLGIMIRKNYLGMFSGDNLFFLDFFSCNLVEFLYVEFMDIKC